MKYLATVLLICACLMLLQIEILLLMSLQNDNLKAWEAQVQLNQSLVDICGSHS